MIVCKTFLRGSPSKCLRWKDPDPYKHIRIRIPDGQNLTNRTDPEHWSLMSMTLKTVPVPG
jgi:hypothetical protein